MTQASSSFHLVGIIFYSDTKEIAESTKKLKRNYKER
jgi:hypothetical protein